MKPTSRPGVGLVSPSTSSSWLGGHYIVQSLFLSAISVDPEERLPFHDVWWNEGPSTDPFADARQLLGPPIVLRMPQTVTARLRRRIQRAMSGERSAGDVFRRAGIDVLFPVPIIENAGVPFVFFLPDFQHEHLRELHDDATLAKFRDYFRTHAAEAARILVTGDTVYRDMQRFMPEHLGKTVSVFPCSVPTAAWFDDDPAKVAAAHGLPERFFVIPNQISAHKNHLTIARALQMMRDRGIDAFVFCTGKTADYRDPSFFEKLQSEINTLGVADRFRFGGVLPRAEQMAIIRRAIAVIQPSEFEGWGAAVAEAKALGKPLLASDLPVHREHRHPSARWIATRDVEGWADAMSEAWNELEAGPDLAAEERARAATASEAKEVGRQFTALLRSAAAE